MDLKSYSADDIRHMRHALVLGARGFGLATPNPCVGSVIVKDNCIIGRGWTQTTGRPHGEFVALAAAGEAARGAIVYTTLEPCAHVSPRGPSCSDLLINAGVAHVVMAMIDPDVRTAGQGRARLNAAGISTTVGVCEEAARHQLRGFRMRLAQGRPWVTVKFAVTIDGFIAQPDGTSQWITGEQARAHVHLVRSQQDAIVVGRATVVTDNPKLDVRLPGCDHHAPLPIMLSSSATAAPAGSHLATNAKTRVTSAPDLAVFLSGLASEGMLHVLVEGGATTAGQYFNADLVDEIHVYRAPVLLGKGRHMSTAFDMQQLSTAHGIWHSHTTRRLGADELTIYLRAREF